MIPIEHVTHWRNNGAAWLLDEQVEQDLVISRALVELFQQPYKRRTCARCGIGS